MSGLGENQLWYNAKIHMFETNITMRNETVRKYIGMIFQNRITMQVPMYLHEQTNSLPIVFHDAKKYILIVGVNKKIFYRTNQSLTNI